ncbi:ATP-dependent RNA helicase DDX54/DBP10 [Nematocida sp. AWRm78]|nr:ATP-dependent RNA helicase DDX54/DBP10 [Nematocida sp. AWRm79]KAI5184041.1 ATP-dependent RNA helicase DDX54/DBP10 [Nematocida sp. AWRm78]
MDFGLNVEVEKKESVSFKGMGIPIEILGNIKYSIATPIQRKVIPKLLKGEDIIAISRTGSGKTYSYVIPILMELLRNREKKTVYTRAKAIIIVPTYELANQVFEVVRELSSNGVHPAMFTGMGTVAHSLNYLVVGQFEVVICTPGRFEHILTEVSSADKNRPIHMKVDEGNIKKEVCITDQQILEKITQPDIVIIDEMDRIFEDKSLSLSLERILEFFKNEPQYALFSATHHRGNTHIRSILNRKDMETVEVIGGVSDHLEQSRLVINNLHVQEEMKMPILLSLLKKQENEKILIFVSTCKRCLMVAEAVKKIGLKMGLLNSSESEESRDLVVKGFKTGEISVLVSTDVGCRGLDIRGINTIIEYDYPACRSTGVHRVGRMNRGRSERGTMYSFIRTADLPTYFAFLNHIHAEKPRDATRFTRLCFQTVSCINEDNHRNCVYLGMGSVPASFYNMSLELARSIIKEDTSYDRSYLRYSKTNPAEKVDPQWVVRSLEVRDIPVHPCFGVTECPMQASIKAYKSRHTKLMSTEHIKKERVKRPKLVKNTVIDMDKFKDPSFIPYENIKSNTFTPSLEIKSDKSHEIKRRIQKMSRPAGQMFTEWKKESRDRLNKGYLLTRPPSKKDQEEAQEGTEAAGHNENDRPKTRKSDGDLNSVRKILEARKKKERDSRRRNYASDRRSDKGRI